MGEYHSEVMRENGVSTDHVNVFPEKVTCALAFLNEQNDAEYRFL